ncbi:MAG: hypothetical protein ACI3XW_00795, partial [Butyricicoccus sp.]
DSKPLFCDFHQKQAIFPCKTEKTAPAGHGRNRYLLIGFKAGAEAASSEGAFAAILSLCRLRAQGFYP